MTRPAVQPADKQVYEPEYTWHRRKVMGGIVLHNLRDSGEWEQKNLLEKGFTLVELLVVIVIIGVLASVVVFAVNGITDRGQTAACKTDKRTIKTAAEAAYAKDGAYPATEALLVSSGFLESQSTMYNYAASGSSYALTVQDTACTGI